MAARLFLLCLCVYLCGALSGVVRIRECQNVDNTQCTINSVTVAPCTHAPAYCYQTRNDPTVIDIEYTPRFNANNLKVSIRADVAKNQAFEKELLAPRDSCQSSDCAIENSMSKLNVNFTYGDKKSYGNFPIQVKLWNAENDDQSCCFLYNVKLLKPRNSG